jgi:hypothetical protein
MSGMRRETLSAKMTVGELLTRSSAWPERRMYVVATMLMDVLAGLTVSP